MAVQGDACGVVTGAVVAPGDQLLAIAESYQSEGDEAEALLGALYSLAFLVLDHVVNLTSVWGAVYTLVVAVEWCCCSRVVSGGRLRWGCLVLWCATCMPLNSIRVYGVDTRLWRSVTAHAHKQDDGMGDVHTCSWPSFPSCARWCCLLIACSIVCCFLIFLIFLGSFYRCLQTRDCISVFGSTVRGR